MRTTGWGIEMSESDVDEVGAPGAPGTPDTPGASARLHQLFEGRRLTPTQRRIAHCLVRQAAAVPFLSSVELAQLAGVSQPSVTRFAVALGFDGYPALRRHLREVAPAAVAVDGRPSNQYQQAVQAEIDNLRQLASLLADSGPWNARAGCSPPRGRCRCSACAPPPPRHAASPTSPRRCIPTYACSTRVGSLLADRIDTARRAGASALLCFALPRHPRELLDALGHARDTGLTVVTIADGTFAPVAAHSDLLLPAAVGTGLVFDTVSAPMLLGQVLLEVMCDGLPDAQVRLEEFDARAAARGLFVD